MSYLYTNFIFNPLYNALIYLLDLFPFLDIGIAVIVFTCLVKFVLYPLSKKALVTQVRMKEIEPKMKEIRIKYANDQKKQAEETFALYRNAKVNPFSSIIVLVIQLPIIFALYAVFARSGLPVINEAILYSFIQPPVIDMNFLGLVDVGSKSIVLALIAGATQYFQLKYSLSNVGTPVSSTQENKSANQGKPDFQEEFAKSMSLSMKYVFPVLMVGISYSVSAAIALYFITSSLFTLVQEIVIRRHIKALQQEAATIS
jgi:YidC/Oxa1 family membrane protein insertase